MNYRHAFHAGNFADVFKHTLLISLLQALNAKPAAYCFVDTHAARGRYDLGSEEARRTSECQDGVMRMLSAPDLPPALQAYVDLVRGFDGGADETLSRYPGSPLIAAKLMREQDRAIVCELQQDEAALLRRALGGDRRFAVHHRDGYEGLKALLPPTEKRGLVLIDPPFEGRRGEFALIQSALHTAHRRWGTASLAVWYPIKRHQNVVPFHRWVSANAGNAIAVELLIHPTDSVVRLNGCGMVIIQPPWRVQQEIATWLPALTSILAAPGRGAGRVVQLAG